MKGRKSQNPSPSPEENFSYWCFISYRHVDNREQDRKWASWIHQEIERYEVPAELVGEINSRRIWRRDEVSVTQSTSMEGYTMIPTKNFFLIRMVM
ncbi:MAG: hypothetical protein P1V20_29755 [Verrucomicrobiales bacterium]|nr:hypothetical protein [Verrucomicrobiales bacterium]